MVLDVLTLPDTRLKKVFVDPMKTTARLITVIVVLALILGSLFAWKMQQIKQQQALMSQAPPPSVVEATRVVEDSWPQSLSAIGSVRAVNGIRIANEMAGVVEHIEFESGQQVSAGDLLLKLNTDTDRGRSGNPESRAAAGTSAIRALFQSDPGKNHFPVGL